MTKFKAITLSGLPALFLCWAISPVIQSSAQGADPLVMVVNKAAPPAPTVSKPEAKRLLLGQTTEWPNGAKVIVVMKAAGSKDRATVLQFVCGMSEAEFTRFQMQVAFTGRQATALHGATSAADTKAFVKANPGAVGFLHASEVGLDVKTVLTLD